MACKPPPFANAVLAEATRVAPRRRGDPSVTLGDENSDGICADARHYAEGGDHVPDARGVPHAVDISQSMPGTPFWNPKFAQFDVMARALKIAARRDSRVKYLVANFGGPDMIWDHDDGWQQNGSYKTEHRSHLHVSFTVAAEQSTAPFFGTDPAAPEEDIEMTEAELRKLLGYTASNGARVPGLLDEAIDHQLGAYEDGKYKPGLLKTALRKLTGTAK